MVIELRKFGPEGFERNLKIGVIVTFMPLLRVGIWPDILSQSSL